MLAQEESGLILNSKTLRADSRLSLFNGRFRKLELLFQRQTREYSERPRTTCTDLSFAQQIPYRFRDIIVDTFLIKHLNITFRIVQIQF